MFLQTKLFCGDSIQEFRDELDIPDTIIFGLSIKLSGGLRGRNENLARMRQQHTLAYFIPEHWLYTSHWYLWRHSQTEDELDFAQLTRI